MRIASTVFASKPRGIRFRTDSFGLPWNIPQSMRIRARSVVSRNLEPVTVFAPPRKVRSTIWSVTGCSPGAVRSYDRPMRQRFLSRSIVPRLPGLLLGLVVFGLGIALMAQAGLGLGPWEAFHQGVSFLTGIPLGTVSILLGIPILLLWWPLGERPGIGTLINVFLIGTATNVGTLLIPTP